MSNTPPDFDFKFLPDWLKEEPSKNAYANYEGRDYDEKPRRDFSKPKPRGGQGGKDQKRGDSPRRPQQRDDRNRPRQQAPAAPVEKPAEVRVEFLPEPNCTVALAKQIKTSARAYPLFELARMFLGKPDRHLVKIVTLDKSPTLHQCGENGPVSLDRQSMEKNAFMVSKHLYYTEETTQGEPPKGNYSNVARCSLSGTLLGPTNYHAYQPTLRKLYEERFSRRMSFADYQREIQIVTDPAVIEAWKDQARSRTVFKTLQEPEPLEFASASEAEQHFRKHYLDKSLRSGNSFRLSGEASRNLPDRNLTAAVRHAWEDENRFPGQLMNHLRHEFIRAGLHIFKHRNRVQLVSGIRPTPFSKVQENLSDTVTGILKVIASTPKCTRVDLAAKILPQQDEDAAKHKSILVADLHWLTHAGHVIEFHNGILELPSVSNPAPEAKKQQGKTVVPAQESGKQAKAEPVEEQAPQETSAEESPAEEPAPLEASAQEHEVQEPQAEPEPQESIVQEASVQQEEVLPPSPQEVPQPEEPGEKPE
ncbi:MAG: hypothetical protein WCD79_07640 [Chthoniobacteraceae bacterium]